jgi:SWIM zinc finger
VIDTVAKAISPKEELNDHLGPIRLGQARKIINTADVVKDIHPNYIVEMQKNNKKTQTREKKNNSDILNNKAIRLVKNRTSDDQQVKRINKAFQIVEHSLKENSLITEEADLKCPQNDNNYTNSSVSNIKREPRVFKVRSIVDKNKIYMVDLENMSCTCADYSFRHLKCKHILATEFTTIEN